MSSTPPKPASPSASPDPQGGSDVAFVATLDTLRALAKGLLDHERKGHTLQATALVNEAFLRLRACGDTTAADPARFLRAAAVTMRRILIEHARGKSRLKRGGGAALASLDSVELASSGNLDQVLMVDEAIETMARDAPEFAEIVRLRFYAGLDLTAVAKVLGKSERTVQREWTYAKARLYQLLGGSG